MDGLLQRLKERKLVQWALAYIAASFALIQVLDVVAQRFGWPDQLEKFLILALALGFFVTLVLAWYHGERGAQKVTGTELLILALLLAVSGGLLWRMTPSPQKPTVADAVKPAVEATAPASEKSIAVLPFVNMSGDAKEDYFSDGITEEILHALAQVPGLQVAGRTSAFAFKGKAEDLRKVGEALGVAVVLEGSVQKAGDEVRITAQLIDVASGFHLWSDKYDRKLTSIFAVEDEISKAIADKLQTQLAGGGLTRKPVDPRAHDFYLRGLTLLAARGPGLRDAEAAFKRAVDIAPDYAQAWGALAQVQALYPTYGLGAMRDAFPRALASAQRALDLNADTASAFVAQGMVYASQWQWAKADAAFDRALALAPGDAETVNQYAQFLAATGNPPQALAEIDRALKLDPLRPVNGTVRASTLYILDRNDEAWGQYQRNVAAYPDFAKAQGNAAYYALATHRWPDAERHARKFAAQVGLPEQQMAALIDLIHGMVDPTQHASAARTLKTAPVWLGIRDADPMTYSGFLCMLDDCKSALPILERIADQGEYNSTESIWDPVFDPIRGDPRFKAILAKMGLPYTPKALQSP